MDRYKRNTTLISILVICVVLLFVANAIFTGFSNRGKTGVTLEVIPKKATVYINDKEADAGVNYLKQGTYTFSARLDGFKDYNVTVKVKDKPIVIGLLPEPETSEAEELINRPSIKQRIEELGGSNANLVGNQLREDNPIVNYLPHTDVYGPFKLDYGMGDGGKIFVIVSDSSPEGRDNALKWIRQQGIDPTDLDIRFQDFTNPLTNQEEL